MVIFRKFNFKLSVQRVNPMGFYTEGLILGVNTMYMPFCFFKLFPMVGKGLRKYSQAVKHLIKLNWSKLNPPLLDMIVFLDEALTFVMLIS